MAAVGCIPPHRVASRRQEWIRCSSRYKRPGATPWPERRRLPPGALGQGATPLPSAGASARPWCAGYANRACRRSIKGTTEFVERFHGFWTGSVWYRAWTPPGRRQTPTGHGAAVGPAAKPAARALRWRRDFDGGAAVGRGSEPLGPPLEAVMEWIHGDWRGNRSVVAPGCCTVAFGRKQRGPPGRFGMDSGSILE